MPQMRYGNLAQSKWIRATQIISNHLNSESCLVVGREVVDEFDAAVRPFLLVLNGGNLTIFIVKDGGNEGIRELHKVGLGGSEEGKEEEQEGKGP